MLRWLNLAKQHQDEQNHQNYPAKPDAGMAEPIAVAPETAAEAAEQVDDHKDDEDQPKGHGTLPLRRLTRPDPPLRLLQQGTFPPAVPREKGGNQAIQCCQLLCPRPLWAK